MTFDGGHGAAGGGAGALRAEVDRLSLPATTRIVFEYRAAKRRTLEKQKNN
jgi:hypothetical protein